MTFIDKVLLWVVLLVVTGLGLTNVAVGQRVPPAPKPSVTAQSVEPTVDSPTVQPTAIAFDISTPVTVRVSITDAGLIPASVVVNKIDPDGNFAATLGSLINRDGLFTATVPILESSQDVVPLRVSAAFRGVLLRSQSDVLSVNVQSSMTVFNPDKDFFGVNQGPDGIIFYYANLPDATSAVRLSRSDNSSGPWLTIDTFPLAPDFTVQPVDRVDGSLSDSFYQLEALSSSGSVLRTYTPLFVPRYRIASPNSAAKSAQLLQASVNPIINTAFITDAILEDSNAMTVYQVRDLLDEKGSFLATPDITTQIIDTDGVTWQPAQTIFDLAQKYTVNPQLILVTMQKEDGLITSNIQPPPGHDGFMGAKGCPSQTLRGQLDCGVSRFRNYLTQLDSTGVTPGGWQVGVPKKTCYPSNCSIENISVTPANRATAALWTYTPVVGTYWGGAPNVLGTSGNVQIWSGTLFKNIVHILKWKNCGACPQAPEVDEKGWSVTMGVAGRSESGQQAVSSHGVSAGLPPSNSYTVTFQCNLFSWDSYNPANAPGTGFWDSFSISVTNNRFWEIPGLSDPLTFPFYLFGGGSFGDGILKQSGAVTKTATATANASGVTYLNVILDTATFPESDNNFPSWGTCKIKKVLPPTPLGIIATP
jgi:hypothetical protein